MYQRILVAVDGSPTSNAGLGEAIRLAQLTHGQMRVIHVIDELSLAVAMDSLGAFPNELHESLTKAGSEIVGAAKETAQGAGVETDCVLRDNLASPVHTQVIAEADAWRADLIVLGTHGRRGVSRLWLGSTAEKVLRSAAVPVLMVRAPEAET